MSEKNLYLLSHLVYFCLSLLVSNHPSPLPSVNRARSLSLCFLDFFFLCRMVISGIQSVTLCSGTLVSSFWVWVSGMLDSITGKPFWVPVSAFVCGKSVFEGRFGLREGDIALWLLWLISPFSAGCCCIIWSTSLCRFRANLSKESKGTGRFWGNEKEIHFNSKQEPTLLRHTFTFPNTYILVCSIHQSMWTYIESSKDSTKHKKGSVKQVIKL